MMHGSTKLKKILEQVKFGFRRERETTDKVVMQITTSEQSLDLKEALCTCFMHCLKAFDGVNWGKETTEVWRLEWETDKNAVIHRFYSTSIQNTVTKNR